MQTGVRDCLLSFRTESFVFQFAVLKYKIYDIHTCNFATILYGCETWALTLEKEPRLRVFENRMLSYISEL